MSSSLLGVCPQICFLCCSRKNIKTSLNAAFVSDGAKNLLLSRTRERGDIFGAVRTLGDVVGFEKAFPGLTLEYVNRGVQVSYQWK